MVLLSVGPRFLGYSSVVIYGGSMAPKVQRGSVAVGKPVDAGSLAVGDIVVYRAIGARTPTLHRIIAIDLEGEERVFTTKGDANAEADPARLHLTGRGTRVIYTVPYAGFLLHARSTSWGRVLFVWLPAMLLLAFVLYSTWRPVGRPPGRAADKGLASTSRS